MKNAAHFTRWRPSLRWDDAVAMIRLFYSPGACSLVAHIALEEAGAELEAVRTPIAGKARKRPEYLAINPRGLIPAIEADGRIVTENIAILAFIGHRAGRAGSNWMSRRTGIGPGIRGGWSSGRLWHGRRPGRDWIRRNSSAVSTIRGAASIPLSPTGRGPG